MGLQFQGGNNEFTGDSVDSTGEEETGVKELNSAEYLARNGLIKDSKGCWRELTSFCYSTVERTEHNEQKILPSSTSKNPPNNKIYRSLQVGFEICFQGNDSISYNLNVSRFPSQSRFVQNLLASCLGFKGLDA